MPPNRGKGQFIVDAAATLSIHDVVGHPSVGKLSSPYPPLTTVVEDNTPTSSVEQKVLNENVEAKEEVAVTAPYVSTASSNIISSDADGIVEKILKDEQIRNLFSIEHIEANLVVAAAQKELNKEKSDEEQQQKAVVVDNSNRDDYWAEEQFTEVKEGEGEGASVPKKFITARYLSDSTHPQQSYWDWPEAGNENTSEKRKETIIENIVLEEKCRELFSIEHIEKTLLEQCTLKDTTTATTTMSGMMTSHHDTTSSAYWEWTTTSSDDNVFDEEEECKEEIIHRILQEENIRQLFSVSHYETNLVLGNHQNEKKNKKTASETKYNDDVDHDSYWDWNGTTASTTKIAPKPPHPNESYWDWDATDDNYNEKKKNRIIQNILEEEKIRQSLSIMHIQEQLVNNAGAGAIGQQKTPIAATTAAASTDTEKGEGGGYWDM